MKRKVLKILAVFMVFAVVTAVAVVAASATTTLTSTSYYARGSECLGNRADTTFNCFTESAHSCNFRLVAKLSSTQTFNYHNMNLAPGQSFRDSNCKGYYNWYNYIQPVNPGSSGVGGQGRATLYTYAS